MGFVLCKKFNAQGKKPSAKNSLVAQLVRALH